MDASGRRGLLHRLFGGTDAPELIAYAKCPSCDCPHSVATFIASRRGGNGRVVISSPSGEVVKCCGCGTVYTVLNDGSVLRGKGRESYIPPTTQNHAPQRPIHALDDDLEDLTR